MNWLGRKPSQLQATLKTQRLEMSTGTLATPQIHVTEWKNEFNLFEPIMEFTVVTFNMLAPCYKRIVDGEVSITGRRERESDSSSAWHKRAVDTVSFLEEELLPEGNIIALQEFWLNKQYTTLFENSFRHKGYEVKSLKRSGSKMDAVAIAVKTADWDIKGSEDVYLCSVGDRVALILWLHHKKTGKNLLIANTHLSYPHNAFDRMNQMRQMRKLTAAIDKFSIDNKVGPATRIVTGDFNAEIRSSVCDHLRSSGYKSSFEICPPIQNENHVMDADGSSDGNSNSHYIIDAINNDNSISNPNSKKVVKMSSIQSKECSIFGTKNTEIDIDNHFVNNFVSHRTHTNEDLGVDHIFIKTEEISSDEIAKEEAKKVSKLIDTLNSNNDSSSKSSSNGNSNENIKIITSSSSYDNIKDKEVYAEIESDMDGIDTIRQLTEEIIADTKLYNEKQNAKNSDKNYSKIDDNANDKIEQIDKIKSDLFLMEKSNEVKTIKQIKKEIELKKLDEKDNTDITRKQEIYNYMINDEIHKNETEKNYLNIENNLSKISMPPSPPSPLLPLSSTLLNTVDTLSSSLPPQAPSTHLSIISNTINTINNIENTNIGNGNSIETVGNTNNVNNEYIHNNVLFILNSRVIPSTIPIDIWSTSFHLSDHRPVSSSIIVAKPSRNM